MTGWRGHQVLYFGDHPYSDLADVTLQHGWRTGAIITELTVNLQLAALLYATKKLIQNYILPSPLYFSLLYRDIHLSVA